MTTHPGNDDGTRSTERGRFVARTVVGLGLTAVLVASCGDDTMDPDPGAPGSETELDGGETGTGSSSSTTAPDSTTGDQGGGGTEGNQIAPGETTPSTAQGNADAG